MGSVIDIVSPTCLGRFLGLSFVFHPRSKRLPRHRDFGLFDLRTRLPARLNHPRNLPLKRQLSEADPTHIELAHIASRPAAQRTTVAISNLEPQFPFDHLGFSSHDSSSLGLPNYFRKGIPSFLSSASPSSSVLAEVTMVTFIPVIFSILS